MVNRDAARAQQIVDEHAGMFLPIGYTDTLADVIAQALAEVRAETVREIVDDFTERAKGETLTVKPGLWFATGLLDSRLLALAQPAPERRDTSECVHHALFDGWCARGSYRCPDHHPVRLNKRSSHD